MKRLLVLLAALAVALACSESWGLAAGYQRPVYILNHSTAVTDQELAQALPAFQASVSLDLAPAWGADAQLVQLPAGQDAPAGGWSVVITDNPDVFCFCAGYHWLVNGVPVGKVFAAASTSWTVTLDHELKELLVDPYADRAALAGDRRWYLVEVGDPVEADTYVRDGVALSDFILPAWYRKWSAAPWDFLGLLKKPLSLTRGGYVSFWKGGRWQQQFG